MAITEDIIYSVRPGRNKIRGESKNLKIKAETLYCICKSHYEDVSESSLEH